MSHYDATGPDSIRQLIPNIVTGDILLLERGGLSKLMVFAERPYINPLVSNNKDLSGIYAK